jgi:ankyrin repeat protein
MNMSKITEEILNSIVENDLIHIRKILCAQGGAHLIMDTDDGIPPLVFAVKSGNLKTVKILVEYHAKVNWMGVENQTPCTIAKKLGFQEIADYLEPLTDPDLQAISDGTIDLDCLEESSKEVIKLFEAFNNGDIDKVKTIIASVTDINIQFEDGVTPVVRAASLDNLEIVKFLVEQGADVNIFDEEMETALSHAYNNNNQKMIDYLIPLTNNEIQEMVRQNLSTDY